MGTDQGKTGERQRAGDRRRQARARGSRTIGTTTFRPPYTPVTFGAIAGRNRERAVRPGPHHADPRLARRARRGVRGCGPVEAAALLPARRRGHARRRRARVPGRARGGRHVRRHHARQDRHPGRATPARFLDRVYTNRFSNLELGRCRYGLMCRDDGMVFDDGVTSRLAPDRFHMTTTTGGAARVLAWLEEWLQTEWPDLEVYCTSVTEQWADDRARRAARRATCCGASAPTSTSRPRPSRTFLARRPGRGHAGARVPDQLLGRARLRDQRAGRLRPPRVGGARARPASRSASRPTAPRRCTCCAPRRATSSSARTPTAP